MAALEAQVTAIFTRWGMPDADVAVTVRHLLYADFHGIDSHGCGMLLDYHRRRATGQLSMTPNVRVLKEGPTTALVDGDGGMGHLAADFATRLAINKCRSAGLAAVAVRNSGHYGAAGAYAAMAAQEGYIGLATTNNRTPAIVPTLGVTAMLGTNPIAIAAPAVKNRPFLLDMATSTAPLGKLMIAWRKGRSIPEGWALDSKGAAVTNPRVAYRHRRLTPLGATREMGSQKGYGLAAAVEILSSVLSGEYAADRGGDEPGVGHFFVVIDPSRFGAEGAFQADLDGLLDGLRASKPARRGKPVMVAGDPEYAAFEQRSRLGVPLARAIIEDMRLVCAQSGVPYTLEGSPAS